MATRLKEIAWAVIVTAVSSAAPSVLAQSVLRGPYLQQATPEAIIVRWRTDQATDGVVRYGTSPGDLTQSAIGASQSEHAVELTGLTPNTRYYYSIGTSAETLAGDNTFTFFTGPPTGMPRDTRIWVVGDSGRANSAARDVRDAYLDFTGTRGTDLWLMLGDNAYPDGTDAEYQAAVFETYPVILRQVPLWPTLGNHDGQSASSATQTGPYYEIFSLPKNAEAGGLASGTEAYYSFDYANIHFVVLDSDDSDRSASGTMLTWLENDLAANRQDWLIAYWHHPPYSKGSHDSDRESKLRDMRENALPLLESYGVDLVLAGHSHSYERSFLIDSHYGDSSSFDTSMQIDSGSGRENDTGAYVKGMPGAMHQGSVYAVAGSSSGISGGTLDHPAMFVSINSLGSMVLDINGDRLDAVFLDDVGNILDNFTMLIEGVSPVDTVAPDSPPNARSTTVTASSITLAWDAATDNVGVTGYEISRDGQVVDTVDALSFTDTGLAPGTTYIYGIIAVDDAGNESPEVMVSATTSSMPSEPAASGGSGRIGPVFLITLSLILGFRRRRYA